MQRRGATNSPITCLAVGNGGVEEIREYLDDASVSWALLRFQVGSTSKFTSVHFNGDDVPTVKRGRLNARTQEVLTMFGETAVTMEVKHKVDLTTDMLCERMLPVMDKANVNGESSGMKKLKEEYDLAITTCKQSQPKDARESGGSGIFTAKDRPELGLTVGGCLKAVGGQQGAFNWVLMEPTKLELHNAGFGGIEEMKKSLDVTKVLFGLVRMPFGRADAQMQLVNKGFMPGIVKHVFVHFVGNKVPVVKRGQWNAKQKDAEKEIKNVCAPMFRKECHTEEELDLEDIIKELQRLSAAAHSESDSDQAKISLKEYEEALSAEKKENMAAGVDSLGGSGSLPEPKQAIDTVRGTSGQWNWALFGAATTPVQPVQSSPDSPANAKTVFGVKKDAETPSAKKEVDLMAAKADAEKAAAEKAAAEKKAAADKAAAEKAAKEKAAKEKETAGKAAASADVANKKRGDEKAAAEMAAAEKASADKAAAAIAGQAAYKAAAAEAGLVAADKTAAEKALFDAAVQKAANEKIEEALQTQRKTLLAEAMGAAVEAAKTAMAEEVAKSGSSFNKSSGTSCSSCGQFMEYCSCGKDDKGDDDNEGKDQFNLSKPVPSTFLGAFDCVAFESDKQLGWFSSSMPPDEVLVVQVEAGAWADKVGIKAGDELMEVQGKDLTNIDQKEFIEFMHKRPLTLSFFRQEGAKEKMLQRGSLPAVGRGSTALRPSVVNRLNAKEDVRASFVDRQNVSVNTSTPSRTSKVVEAFPQWEDYTGELHIRSGWAWKRRFVQLAQGRLRWWKQKDVFEQTPRPAAEVDLCLVQATARWKVEGLKGSRFELNLHPVEKVPPRTMEEPKPEAEKEEPKEKKSFMQRVSTRASSVGAKIRSSSAGAKKDAKTGPASVDPTDKKACQQYLIAGDDIASATEWARAIWHHIAYVDMLCLWPMPLEGRQGDIKFYGINVEGCEDI